MSWGKASLVSAVTAAVALAGGVSGQAPATNWPQWRGPLGTGMAPNADPPLRWDDRTNVRWKAPLPGRGSATPIVWGDRVFVTTAIDTGKAGPKPAAGTLEKRTESPGTLHEYVVLCLARDTGKVLWRQVAVAQVPHEGRHPTHSFAASSPVTDGKRLIVSFGSRGVFGFDLDGKKRWEVDFGDMDTRLGWGEGASPAMKDGIVIVNWDHEGQDFITALDADTGKPRWKKERDEPTSWATPLIVEHAGRSQVIVNATNRVRSYDLQTGEELWQCGGQTVNAIPSPVAAGGVVYCTSGYRGQAAVAIPLDSRGDVTDSPKLRWKHDRGTPYVPSPLLADGRLYFTQNLTGIFTILDTATGRPTVDQARVPDLKSVYSSPAGAGDRLYLTDRDGTTVVLRRADRVEVLAVNRLGDPVDSSPAIVGRQLLLRSEKAVYCFEEAR